MKFETENVRELYFEHQELTRINGGPMFITLHNMALRLKSNAISIPCTLGGGAYGYISIIMSPVTYATLAPFTPFIIIVPPESLNVADNAMQYQITHTISFTKPPLISHVRTN